MKPSPEDRCECARPWPGAAARARELTPPESPTSAFASESWREHFARGAFGFSTVALGLFYGGEWGIWSFPVIAAGVLALRGCPMCWLSGAMSMLLGKRGA